MSNVPPPAPPPAPPAPPVAAATTDSSADQMKIPRKTVDTSTAVAPNPVNVVTSPQDPRTPTYTGGIPPPPPPPPPPKPFLTSDVLALQAQLPGGIKIPPGLDPKILLSSDRALRMLKELTSPVQMQAALDEFTEAMKNKGDRVRNAQAYLVGVIKRYITVSQKDSNAPPIMGENITPIVKSTLQNMITSGFCSQQDLSDKVYAKIKMLSENDAILAIEEISSVQRDKIRNFPSYFMGILNRYMRGDETYKGRKMGTNSNAIPVGMRPPGNDIHNRSNDTRRRSRDDYDRYRRSSPSDRDSRRRRSRSEDSDYSDKRHRRRRSRRYRSDSDSSDSSDSRDYRRRRDRDRSPSRSRDRYEGRRDRRRYRSRSRSRSSSPSYRRDRDSRRSRRDKSDHRRNNGVPPPANSALPLPGMMPPPFPNGIPPPPPPRVPPAAPSGNQAWQQNNQSGNILMQSQQSGFPASSPTNTQSFPPQQQAGSYGPASVPQGIPDILGIAEKAASAVQALTRQQQATQPPALSTLPPPQQSQPYSVNAYSNSSAPPVPNKSEFGVKDLSSMIQFSLKNLQATGHLDKEPGSNACRLMNNLPEAKALEALEKFSSCDASIMRSKEGYLIGILRKTGG